MPYSDTKHYIEVVSRKNTPLLKLKFVLHVSQDENLCFIFV